MFPEALRRRFRLIAFDWDGTAVESRYADASAARAVIERLLEAGVVIVVVTGTSFANVDRQLSAAIRNPSKQNLFVATNRGSEVYGFDAATYAPVLVASRRATPEEEAMLTRAAESLRDELMQRTGLPFAVVYDRLNRRKVDLIPEWADPPKSAIAELLVRVEQRLARAGDSLASVLAAAERHARAAGLPDPRITSDVKHVEIGLTDKSDSIAWVTRELAPKRGIAMSEVLIVGDEFGSIAGMIGSDSKMITPEAFGATFASVGPEPNGAPPHVIALGGGPARFVELLAAQAMMHPLPLPATPTTDPSWLVVESGFVPAREHEIESVLAIGNGYVGSRSSLAEGSALSKPATLVAGVFEIASAGAMPELAHTWDWTALRATIGGAAIGLVEGEREHRRVLDMQQAIAWRHWRHASNAGLSMRIEAMRFASLADRHVIAHSVTLTPENFSERAIIDVALADATEASALPDGTVTMTRGVRGTGIVVAFAIATRLRAQDGALARVAIDTSGGRLVERWEIDLKVGTTYRLDRIVVVYTSRDDARPTARAIDHLARARDEGMESLVRAHASAWRARWRTADVTVVGDPPAQRALRFAAYHLVSSANPDDERVSIGARALSGDAYKGHVFWDTELFMLPFFTMTHPESARALLMYRAHTLAAARDRAARNGYRGALFAWESAHTGEDVTPPYVLSPKGEVWPVMAREQEHHISADVAYAVDAYLRATGDDAFFARAGAEILIETARFWASRATLSDDGRYHILRVIGPDEYHEGVDDSTYTNAMAQWNLERGAAAASELARRMPDVWARLKKSIAIDLEEASSWRAVAHAMAVDLDPKNGVIEQFRGYFDLEDVALSAFVPRTAPMDVLLGRERIRRTQVVKQADIVMLLYLLWDRIRPEVRRATFRYYEPRTAHGSSLSPAIHAIVAARLGDRDLAERYFRQAREIDLANNMGNAAGGVHAAALGALWQAATFGFAGMRVDDDGAVRFDPHPLPSWRALRFDVIARGAIVPFSFSQEERAEAREEARA